jgi:adenine-specific DNA-methyltransferase
MQQDMAIELLRPRSADEGPHLLDFSWELQKRYEAGTSSHSRKKKGQFFTPPSVCRFLAGLLGAIPQHFRILDPGAGLGSLCAGVCERLLEVRSPRSLEIHLFENDPEVIPLLEENMRNCRRALQRAGHGLTYTVYADDFLTANTGNPEQNSFMDNEDDLGQLDAVIMNPPYFKIGGDSAYAKTMRQVVHGQPNIYALFMAKAAELLRPEGNMVAITPRSFCNGLYFRNFRRWFFTRLALERIHLFESRSDTFKSANVLQESIITQWRRLGRPSRSIRISTSLDGNIVETIKAIELPGKSVVDDSCGDMVVRIPATIQESKIIQVLESWPDRFNDLGLRVSTGPVVLFRTKRFLLKHFDGLAAVPLLTVHNVGPFRTNWPLPKRDKATAFRVCPGSLKYLLPTRNYVLLRRFSAKEEPRRLTASCYLAAEHEHRPYVALENHLNYIYHAKRDLTAEETFGLAAVFNSALFDRYFRTISGNTQVNATEIRTIKFPNLATVSKIGWRVKGLGQFQPQLVEKIVLGELGINGPLERYLTQFVVLPTARRRNASPPSRL